MLINSELKWRYFSGSKLESVVIIIGKGAKLPLILVTVKYCSKRDKF